MAAVEQPSLEARRKPRLDLAQPRSRKRAVLWHMGGYTLNALLLIVQGFVLIPLYLHHLGDRLYGFWLASGGILAWMGVLELGVTGIVMQRCAAACGRRDLLEVGRYLRTGILMVGAFALVVLAVAAVLAPRVPTWLGVDGPSKPDVTMAFLLAALALALSLGNDLARSFCMAVQRNAFAVFAELAGNFLSILATVVGLQRGLGLIALPLGFVVRAVFCLAVNGTYTLLLARGTGGSWLPERHILKDFARIGPAALASRFVCGLTRQIEPLLIAFFLRPELAVVFTVTQRALSAVEPFVNQINGAPAGAFSHLIGEGNIAALRRAVHQGITFLGAGTIVVGLGYSLGNAGFVHLWVSDERFGGQALTVALAAASLTSLFSRFVQMLVGAAGDQVFAGYISAAEAGLRLLGMGLLLLPLGLIAFPVATIAATLAIGYVCWRRLHRILPAAPEAMRAGRWLPVWALAYIALGAVAAHWVPRESWVAWFVATGVVVGLGALPLLSIETIRDVAMAGLHRLRRASA